jgi:hypothetical protein
MRWHAGPLQVSDVVRRQIAGRGCATKGWELQNTRLHPWLHLQQICSEQPVELFRNWLNSLKINSGFIASECFSKPPIIAADNSQL